MKQLFVAVALSAVALAAQAQVTFSGGTARANFPNYDPTGPAGTLAPTGGFEDAAINTTAGTLTATFLGFEALNIDTFTFSMGAFGTLNNRQALLSTISGFVNGGALNFRFEDMTGGGIGNGGNPGIDFLSYAVLGDFRQGTFFADTLGGTYDLILGFNDGLRVDADYDDIVIGLKVTPIPEPETYALMLAGLGALGFISRRRRKTL